MGSKEVRKEMHDRYAFNRDIGVGDLVALKNNNMPVGLSKKLHPGYKFPYLVVAIKWPNVQIKPVGSPNDIRVWEVHIDRLKHYRGVFTHPTSKSKPLPSVQNDEDDEYYFCKYCKKSYFEEF